jgi:hypothetical protein
MKNTVQIDLNQPVEHVVAAVLSLPSGAVNADKPDWKAKLIILVRGIYEAANGRRLETSAGFVSTAPAVAEFLKAKPFYAASQTDFVIDVAARLIGEPNHSVSTQLATELLRND